MKQKIYIEANLYLFNIISQILHNYNLILLSSENANNKEFKNNNVIVFLNKCEENKNKENFFLNNNVLVFINNREEIFKPTKFKKIDCFYGQFNIKKFYDEVISHFISKKIFFKNIEILDEKITNTKQDLSILLTPLEKEILIVLFENRKTHRDYLLEKILKIKKSIETKTVESHFTRIRGKLLKIKSEIKIRTKDNIFYLDY